MKKQVMKLLRLAKREGDADARDVLDYIKKCDLMNKTMTCTGSCYEWTYFKWDDITVHYNGLTEEITVYIDNNHWTLCE